MPYIDIYFLINEAPVCLTQRETAKRVLKGSHIAPRRTHISRIKSPVIRPRPTALTLAPDALTVSFVLQVERAL